MCILQNVKISILFPAAGQSQHIVVAILIQSVYFMYPHTVIMQIKMYLYQCSLMYDLTLKGNVSFLGDDSYPALKIKLFPVAVI